jgi:hypothetical protein
MGLFAPNIEKLKAARNVTALAKALRYTSGDLGKAEGARVSAANALGELRDPQAIPDLAKAALHNPEGDQYFPQPEDPLVRAAARALADIGPAGVEPLIAGLGQGNPAQMMCHAALALGELRFAPALSDLVAMRAAVEEKIRSMPHRQAFLENWYQFRNILNWSIDRIDPGARTPRPARDSVTGEARCAICGRTDGQLRTFLTDIGKAEITEKARIAGLRFAEFKLVRVCSNCGEAFCVHHMHFTPEERCPGCAKPLPIEPAKE